ncbi:hypothetical protein DEU56DRAFT_747713 [Suillus clintonianus]|uniref:uncharacterized protein n=1 Tax=Suillus clintonianus TaxID=1904413 RepID=UPI001B87E026|nr:uncharacterized protein DEU56DRAFT_747713 [Suillus clintonianus]KAG2118428.1 hypothetical protein DEU56DRAFT_747713 [Suillus clintonianus]
MSYPVHWLKTTFSSRTRTVELLQPELEKGVITKHDFDLATRFLPGGHRHWPVIYGVGAAGASLGYGRSIARPRWSHTKLVWVSGAATLMGMVFGQVRQVLAHKQFTEALENPAGFMEALRDVDRRLGGDGHLGFTLERIRKDAKSTALRWSTRKIGRKPGLNLMLPMASDRPDSGICRPDIITAGSPQAAQPKNRWEEIRAANARSAGYVSSWDTIRQRHERNRLPDSTSSPPSNNPGIDERTTEQAKFDAILEAERRRGQSQDSRDFV